MFKKSAVAAALATMCTLAQAANPLVTNIFTADPAALVDGNRVYLYVGHDEAAPEGKDYLMREWRVLSSCDMKNWTDMGSPLNVKTFKWAKADAWAADVTKRNGKYYFYAPVDTTRASRARRSAWRCRTSRPAPSSMRAAAPSSPTT